MVRVRVRVRFMKCIEINVGFKSKIIWWWKVSINVEVSDNMFTRFMASEFIECVQIKASFKSKIIC